jgi:hypothetical protein
MEYLKPFKINKMDVIEYAKAKLEILKKEKILDITITTRS